MIFQFVWHLYKSSKMKELLKMKIQSLPRKGINIE